MVPTSATETRAEHYSFNAFSTVRWLLSAVVLTAYSMVAEWLIRTQLLHSLYAATPDVWRHSTDGLFPFTFILPFAVALIISSAYRNFYKRAHHGKGSIYRKSIKFGIWTGLLIGSLKSQSYLYLPIAGELAAASFITATIKGIGTGIVLCAVYQYMQPKAST